MTHALCLLLATIGFAAISLSMSRHQLGALSRRLPNWLTLILRTAGFAALALALAVAVRGFGAGIGSIVWFGHLSAAALLVLGLHTWRAQHDVGSLRPASPTDDFPSRAVAQRKFRS